MAFDDVRGDLAIFRGISRSLAEAIGRADYPVGGQLAPEFTLMRTFGASRFTIREALAELRSRRLIASRRGLGSVELRVVPQEAAFIETSEFVDGFLAGIVQAPIVTLEITDLVADSALAARLRCEGGRQFIMLRGERQRRSRPEEASIALVRVPIDATYGPIRTHFAKPTESPAGIAEKVLNVQRIVQELQPTALNADAAASLAAPVGCPAMRHGGGTTSMTTSCL